jgi:hypothetical protein
MMLLSELGKRKVKNKSRLGNGTVLPSRGPAVLDPYKTKKGNPRPTRKIGEWGTRNPRPTLKLRGWGTQTQEKNKPKKEPQA